MKHNKLYKKFAVICACIIIIALLSGISLYLSYHALVVTEYTISSDKITEDIGIVMLSDLHDSQFGEENSKLIAKVSTLKPDLILVLGDMVSNYTEDISHLNPLYSALSDIAPTYCVEGNHEQSNEKYEEIKKIMAENTEGFFDAEYQDIVVKGNDIRIGGIAFYLGWDEEYNAFAENFANTDSFKLILYHHPEYYIWGMDEYDIDLTLSGHTHGGQVILPFAGGIYAPEQGYFPEYDFGHFSSENGDIVISRGLGSSKQPVPRFNNPPEIVCITLTPTDGGQ